MARGQSTTFNNEFSETERSILSEIYGITAADKIISEANDTKDDFDPEIQEILDDVLPLDEM